MFNYYSEFICVVQLLLCFASLCLLMKSKICGNTAGMDLLLTRVYVSSLVVAILGRLPLWNGGTQRRVSEFVSLPTQGELFPSQNLQRMNWKTLLMSAPMLVSAIMWFGLFTVVCVIVMGNNVSLLKSTATRNRSPKEETTIILTKWLVCI